MLYLLYCYIFIPGTLKATSDFLHFYYIQPVGNQNIIYIYILYKHYILYRKTLIYLAKSYEQDLASYIINSE